jgi:hypothetical protein
MTLNSSDRYWYVADALMAGLTIRHHHVRAASEDEAERRMHARYPEAAAILVRQEQPWRHELYLPGPLSH